MKRAAPIPAFLGAGHRAYRERGGGINRGFIGNLRWQERVVRRLRAEGATHEVVIQANGRMRLMPIPALVPGPRG